MTSEPKAERSEGVDLLSLNKSLPAFVNSFHQQPGLQLESAPLRGGKVVEKWGANSRQGELVPQEELQRER